MTFDSRFGQWSGRFGLAAGLVLGTAAGAVAQHPTLDVQRYQRAERFLGWHTADKIAG
jgi:hypothetical protein